MFKKTTVIDYKLINDKIKENINKDVFQEVDIITEKVKSKTYLFLEYFETRKELQLNKSTVHTYETAIKNFKGYLSTINREDVEFSEIDSDFIKKLSNHFKSKGLEGSTIRFLFNTYSTVFNKASKSKVYIYSNPFKDETKEKVNGKPKRVLQIEDLRILMDLRKGDKYWLESRIFLFCFLGNGMRVGDMFMMKIGNIKKDELVYRQMKVDTNIKLKYNEQIFQILFELVGLDEWHRKLLTNMNSNMLRVATYNALYKTSDKTELEELFSDYEGVCKRKLYYHISKMDKNQLLFKDYFDYPEYYTDYDKTKPFNENQFIEYKRKLASYNVKLKRMAKMYNLSITDIITHSARFTFTNVLLDMKEINLNDIRIALGHTNIGTTQKYIQKGFDFKKSDVLNEKLSSIFQVKI